MVEKDELVVWRPFLVALGELIPVRSALLNKRKKTYWVEFADGDTDFFPESDVVWQRVLEFPES